LENMMSKAKVLVIDDDLVWLDLARFHLESNGYEVIGADNGAQGLKLVADRKPEVALTDLRLPDISGIDLVSKMKEASPGTEVIMITAYSTVNEAIEATKAGAFYFSEKAAEFEELMALIERAIERGRQAEEIEQLRGRLRERDSYYNIIGSSRAMQNIYEIIESIAESDANVMILGESGTGKELIANAIHFKSARSKKPFVKINCAALPKELIESELFGHVKGAFTGATMDKPGLISRADGGSLLLDEITEMPVELQPKLLRVLQERVYHRLGSEKAQQPNFRLICATNRHPSDGIREGYLREDLYYRISTIEIVVPPLRERMEDIHHLTEYFLQQFAEKYQRPKASLSQQSYQRLFEYSWPGNVRELQNVLERATLLSKGETIEIEELLRGHIGGRSAISAPPAASEQPASHSIAIPHDSRDGGKDMRPNKDAQLDHTDMSFDEIGKLIIETVPDPKNGAEPVDVFGQIERAVVSAALKRTGGNKQAAANLLGVYRPRLYNLIKKHKLAPSPASSQAAAPPQELDGQPASEIEQSAADAQEGTESSGLTHRAAGF